LEFPMIGASARAEGSMSGDADGEEKPTMRCKRPSVRAKAVRCGYR